jgi:hypothetical protein
MSAKTAKVQNQTGHRTEPLALTSNDVLELNQTINHCGIRTIDKMYFQSLAPLAAR